MGECLDNNYYEITKFVIKNKLVDDPLLEFLRYSKTSDVPAFPKIKNDFATFFSKFL